MVWDCITGSVKGGVFKSIGYKKLVRVNGFFNKY